MKSARSARSYFCKTRRASEQPSHAGIPSPCDLLRFSKPHPSIVQELKEWVKVLGKISSDQHEFLPWHKPLPCVVFFGKLQDLEVGSDLKQLLTLAWTASWPSNSERPQLEQRQ